MASDSMSHAARGGAQSGIENDDAVGYSFTLGWDPSRAQSDAQQIGAKKRKEPSHVFVQVLVFTSGQRLLGFPGASTLAPSTTTTCSIRFNVPRPGDLPKVNTLGIKLMFPKDSAMTGQGIDDKLEVELLLRAPHYEVVYEGPMDPVSLPVSTRIAAADRQYSLYRIRVLDGAKPVVVGFPSEHASMVAKMFVPILENQDSFLVAIVSQSRGHIKRWCREAVLGYY
ncbi:hypothetical protein PG985_010464 [Apiospora marii]|uniref:Uncharacterized protein n=1 Tax=Apiospora marii TaxID=335849 RepID=A0ABR1RZT3_9PEZI